MSTAAEIRPPEACGFQNLSQHSFKITGRGHGRTGTEGLCGASGLVLDNHLLLLPRLLRWPLLWHRSVVRARIGHETSTHRIAVCRRWS